MSGSLKVTVVILLLVIRLFSAHGVDACTDKCLSLSLDIDLIVLISV